jgi:hypothetical protein
VFSGKFYLPDREGLIIRKFMELYRATLLNQDNRAGPSRDNHRSDEERGGERESEASRQESIKGKFKNSKDNEMGWRAKVFSDASIGPDLWPSMVPKQSSASGAFNRSCTQTSLQLSREKGCHHRGRQVHFLLPLSLSLHPSTPQCHQIPRPFSNCRWDGCDVATFTKSEKPRLTLTGLVSFHFSIARFVSSGPLLSLLPFRLSLLLLPFPSLFLHFIIIIKQWPCWSLHTSIYYQ